MRKPITLINWGHLCCLITFLLVSFEPLSAQFLLQKSNPEEAISIHSKAEYVDVGKVDVTFEQIRTIRAFQFLPMEKENRDFGFTNHNIWVRFQLKTPLTNRSITILKPLVLLLMWRNCLL